MNLKSYFNKNYAFQNIKKSKGILALFLGMVPILNSLILLLICVSQPTMLSFDIISGLTIVGLYFLPGTISLCLFGYIFKKKSVDFIGSMPISRKTIFITNTITGIVLILLTLGMNAILILCIGFITSSIIPLSMILDYFLIWTISYLFAFVISNIAVSISGNAITSVITMIVLLLVIPFIYDYTTNTSSFLRENYNINIECKELGCIPQNYTCYNDKECSRLKDRNIYKIYDVRKVDTDSFTFLYHMPRKLISNQEGVLLYDRHSIEKMTILMIIGFLVGLKIFENRKMENNETSFKSDYTHSIIKGLFLAPVFTLFSHYLNYEIGTVLFFTLIVGSYFLYDLITRKNISSFFKTMKHLLITMVLFFVLIKGVENHCQKLKKDEPLLSSNDIESIVLEDSNISLSEIDNPEIRNRKTIQEILRASFNEYLQEETMIYKRIILREKDGSTYEYFARFSYHDLENIEKKIMESSDYLAYKNFSNKKFYAFKIGNIGKTFKMDRKAEKIIRSALQHYDSNQNSNMIYSSYIYVTSYEKGENIDYRISSGASKELEKLVSEKIQFINQEVVELMTTGEIKFTSVSASIGLPSNYSYIFERMENELLTFITKYKDDRFNCHQDYISLYTNNHRRFETNRVKEFVELINKKEKELKEDPEYQRWLEYNNTTNGEDKNVDD